MEIVVSGRRMEVSDKLRNLAESKVAKLGRFLDMEHAEVLFSRERNPRIPNPESCEITLEGHGHHVRTRVSAPDAFAAIDKAVAKAEQQLSKLKARLVTKGKGRDRSGAVTLAGGAAAALLVDEAVEAEVEVETDHVEPRIVKAKRFAMMPMTPEEAAGRMDLLGHGFFFFTNIDTHRAAVVYRRADGDVGLIDEAD